MNISDLQMALNQLGADPKLVVDGVSGPKTKVAIAAFQKTRGLAIDGIAGPLTMAALAIAQGKPAPSGASVDAYCACIFGLGGSMLDPAGGMATLNAKIGALGVKVAAQPWDQTNVQGVADYLKSLAASTKIAIIGDSCGANKAPWVAAAIAPRKVAYIACIQASEYCQSGCPDIGANVDEAFVIYSDWLHTGGLGVYVPIRAAGNTHTKYRQSYVPAAHPDDNNVLRVQNPILADIKRIIA